MTKTKPFEIPKKLVYQAYKAIKANKGAAGIDEVAIEDFEKDLKNNLYKLWNRMSSGTYFPPPVKSVEIPKKSGGIRVLGIPTVADRISYLKFRHPDRIQFAKNPYRLTSFVDTLYMSAK